MKAILMARPQKGGIQFTDKADVPKPGFREVLIRVKAAGMCGTDRHIYNWDASIRDMVKPPMIFGHEFCGEIAELGPETNGTLKVGDYVSCEMHEVCGRCYQCRTGQGHLCPNTAIYGVHKPGCFAEYVKVPASNVIHLPKEAVPIKIGAFLDALGNAVHTAMATDIPGRNVAITGYGPIGAMAAAVVEFCGAGSITIADLNPFALERAEAWKKSLPPRRKPDSIRIVSMSAENREASMRRTVEETEGGVDAVLEMSGAERAINDALRMTRNGGEVVLLGLPSARGINLENYKEDVIFRGIELKGIVGRKMYDTWYRMLAFLKAGLEVEHVVTTEASFADCEEAFHLFSQGRTLKVVLYPNGK
jgi:threonine 3-dehydrogenase